MADRQQSTKPRFVFKPDVPLPDRLKWIGGLIGVGILVQASFSVFLGWVLVLAGGLMGLIQGHSTKPDLSQKGEWQTTTIEELEDVEQLSRKITEWKSKSGVFQANSGTGCALFVAALAGLALCTVFIGAIVDRSDSQGLLVNLPRFAAPLRGGAVSPILFLDGLTLVILLWFSGWLSAWEPPQVPLKAGYLMTIYRKTKNRPELEFLPSLYLSAKEDISVPWDCRLLVKIKDAPPEFMGIQVQISMNDVQGTKYPYCYAVIIAKKEFRLHARASACIDAPAAKNWLMSLFKSSDKEAEFHRFNDMIVELDTETDVDVAVVRQETSGKGYHTTEEQAMAVFTQALRLAELILKNPG